MACVILGAEQEGVDEGSIAVLTDGVKCLGLHCIWSGYKGGSSDNDVFSPK